MDARLDQITLNEDRGLCAFCVCVCAFWILSNRIHMIGSIQNVGYFEQSRLNTRATSLMTGSACDDSAVAKRRRGRSRKTPDKDRLSKSGHRSASSMFASDPICPICGGHIPGDEDDASAHVEDCLKLQGEPVPKVKLVTFEETDVNIVDNEEVRYGRPQYTDHDVAAVLSAISTKADTSATVESYCGRDSVKALLQTVQLQDQIIQRIPRCLICLEPHRKPVVSTMCWHVFCEACWLQSLASKRVCPHCSSITSPEDLRRIFL